MWLGLDDCVLGEKVLLLRGAVDWDAYGVYLGGGIDDGAVGDVGDSANNKYNGLCIF